MQSQGELNNNRIIIKKPKDIGRLYSKSHFGTLLSNNKLELNLLEAAFLSNEGKLRIFNKKKELEFQDIVKIASVCITDFEIKYLVFKDLRSRGYPIVLSKEKDFATFYKYKNKGGDNKNNKQLYISTCSERDFLDINKFIIMIKKIQKKNGLLWLSIVDEEGDITYYEVSSFKIKGEVGESTLPKISGYLLKNRIIIFDKDVAEKLHQSQFFGKPFGNGLQLSLVESLYLSDNGVLDVETTNGKRITKKKLREYISKLQPDITSIFPIYEDLKKRGFIVKTGFKYGSHFRVYTKCIGETHADYLVHVLDSSLKFNWADMSRAVRLAHSVNKEFVFAKLNRNSINYIKLGRLRP